MLLKFFGVAFSMSLKRDHYNCRVLKALKVDCCYRLEISKICKIAEWERINFRMPIISPVVSQRLDVRENICKLKFAYGTELVRLAKCSTLEGPMQFRHLGHTMADGIKC